MHTRCYGHRPLMCIFGAALGWRAVACTVFQYRGHVPSPVSLNALASDMTCGMRLFGAALGWRAVASGPDERRTNCNDPSRAWLHTDHGKRRTVGKRGEGGREPEANKATGPPSTIELYTAAAFEPHAACHVGCQGIQ